MKKLFCILLVTMMVLSLCACGTSQPEPETPVFQAGFGRENVMPKDITAAHLAGGDDASRKATGFLDYLFVTCVAIKDKTGETALIYTMDLILADENFVGPIRKLISGATNVKEENIMIAATHTHSAVSVRYSWDGSAQYKEMFQLAMIAAAETAIADLSPADLYIGSTQAEDLVFVRHYLLKDGTVTSSGVGAGSDLIAGHPAEKDAEVQIIRFARPAEDKKDVVLVSFNSHPTFNEGGLMISADFPSPTRDYIESQGDYLVAYFTGDAGNQEEYSKIIAENHGLDYRGFGQKLGQYVIDAMPTLKQIETGNIKVLRRTNMVNSNKERLDMYMQASEVMALKRQSGIDAANELAKEYGLYLYLEASSILNRAEYPDQIPITLSTLSIGDYLSFAFAPYEMFSENGSYIRANSPFNMTFLVSCANGSESYIPSTAAMEYGCYEGYVTRYERGSGEAFAKEFVDMATELKNTNQ